LWEGHKRETLTAQDAEPESQGSDRSEDEGAAMEDAKPEVTITMTTSDPEGEEEGGTKDDEGADETPQDAKTGFAEDPFVVAAGMFRARQYHGIIEKLTEAVEKGEG